MASWARGKVQLAGTTKHPKLPKSCLAKICDFMPPSGPGEAEITAATLPGNGSGSARHIQSSVFFSNGVMKPLYSGEAIRSA